MLSKAASYFESLVWLDLGLCYILICSIITTQWQRTSEDFFSKYIYTSLFICNVCVWEGAGDRTETEIFWSHSYGRQRRVFLVLQGYSTGGPKAHSSGWWLSLQHLISNFSGPKLIGCPESPFSLAWLSLPHLISNLSPTVWIFVLTELYNSSTPIQSPTRSLEWHVWSSSSGNNSHAAHRSLSSGAPVCSSTVGPSPCPILSALIRPRDLFRLLAIGMCHLLPVHHFEIAYLPGSKVKIQQLNPGIPDHYRTLNSLGQWTGYLG